MDTRDLRQQHADIIAQVEGILTLLEMPSAVSVASDIGERLDVLSSFLGRHLAQEDRDFYPTFIRSRDENLRTLAERFFVEMGHLRRAFSNFREAWRSRETIRSRIFEFGLDAQRIFSLLTDRIQREDEILFPLWEKGVAGAPTGQEEQPVVHRLRTN